MKKTFNDLKKGMIDIDPKLLLIVLVVVLIYLLYRFFTS